MTNSQGTVWETEIVRAASNSHDHRTGRHPKRGQANEPDVYFLYKYGIPDGTIPVVAWKRLVGKKGDGPRQPDGERRVVVIGFDDFIDLLPFLPYDFEVQAKWTANLNVTKTLAGLRAWMKEHQ